MKHRASITTLTVCILLLSAFAACMGIFSSGGSGGQLFSSVRGEQIALHGTGLYRYDSVSMAAQAIAQDYVTLLMGAPLLLISLLLARRGSLVGRLLLTGTLAYFLYTYTSYSFTSMYNRLFLVNVALLSMGVFAFVLAMLSFDARELAARIEHGFPGKSVAIFLMVLGTMVGLMWLGKVAPTIFDDVAPAGLEHYTTLVIQALDLGLLVPACWVTGILLLRKKPHGLLLGAVMCVKGATMLTALTAMVIGQLRAGVEVPLAVCFLFPAANITAIAFLVALLRHTKNASAEKAYA